MRMLAGLILSIAVGVPGFAGATPAQVSYFISATDMQNAGVPPPAPTSSSVQGTYTFMFDPVISSQNGIVPDSVVGLDIFDNNGTLIGFDETDSGVDVAVNVVLQEADVTVGGTLHGVPFMLGISNDFSVRFKITLVDFTVISVLQDLAFVTTVDAFYQGPTTVTGGAAPEPPALLLIAAGLAALRVSRRTPLNRAGSPSTSTFVPGTLAFRACAPRSVPLCQA